MIDPYQITNFNRTDYELQEFWIFCIFVAGKPANRTAKIVQTFLLIPSLTRTLPFTHIGILETFNYLDEALHYCKVGQYKRIYRALSESKSLNLRKVTIEDLEKVYGVGPKTSRFFLVHSRPNQRYAILDTHILKFLRDCGYSVPKNTPSSYKKYLELEELVLKELDKTGKSMAQFDLDIWRKYNEQNKI